MRLSSAPMQTPAPRSTIVAGATLLRDRGLLLPALLLPASCSDCSRFVVLALLGPAKDAARASSVSERASLDTLDCARIGLDSLCSNMATCFALFCAAGSDSDTASSLLHYRAPPRGIFCIVGQLVCLRSSTGALSGALKTQAPCWLDGSAALRACSTRETAQVRRSAARCPGSVSACFYP